MTEAGYSAAEAEDIRKEVAHYENVRREVKLGAGEDIDYKAYEADMRFLLDTFIRAEDSETVMSFEEDGLVALIAKKGADEAIKELPKGIKDSKEATAETIENNTRKLIIDERPINPKYYDKMSDLLDVLIEQRRDEALDYKAYLEKLEALIERATKPDGDKTYPAEINSGPRRALYDNLGKDEELAIELDQAIRHALEDSWRGSMMKERKVQRAIRKVIETSVSDAKPEEVLELARHQDAY